MAESKEDSTKAKLDNGDIKDELGLDKADLDSEGILEKQDKAVLDKEGILDKDGLIQEKEKAGKKQPEKVKERKEKKKAEGKRLELFLKLKDLPWVKISAVFGGTIVLFFSGWFFVSYFLLSTSPEKGLDELNIKDLGIEEILNEPSRFNLEPFIVPLHDPKKGTSFLRIKVFLNLRYDEEKKIVKKNKDIRSTIYNLLLHKKTQDILDARKREGILEEMRMLLNNVLEKDVVINVKLMDILLE